jgi:general secretion pathway protein H
MRSHFNQSGHTLLELLVVLAIVALAAAAAWPSFGGARERATGRVFAHLLQDELQGLRSRAVYEGEAAAFEFAPGSAAEGARWRAGDGDWSKAPQRVTLALDAPSAAGHSIHFFADGSTSGGAVLITVGRRTWRVSASLAGDVSLDDAPQPDR